MSAQIQIEMEENAGLRIVELIEGLHILQPKDMEYVHALKNCRMWVKMGEVAAVAPVE